MSFRGQGYGPQAATGTGYNGGSSGKKTSFDEEEAFEDEAYEGALEHPPFLKLGIGFCEFVAGLLCNCVQVTTSTYAFMSSMQGQAVRVLNVRDLMALNPAMFTMAIVISIAVQLILHMNAQSMSSTWRRLRHIKVERVNALPAKDAVRHYLSLRNILFAFSLFLDVVGDGRFATLYTTEWLAVLAWIVLLTSLSTIVMYDGATRMWGALQDMRDFRLYRERTYQ